MKQLDQEVADIDIRTVWHEEVRTATNSQLVHDGLDLVDEGLRYIGVEPGKDKIMYVRPRGQSLSVGAAHGDREVSIFLRSSELYRDNELAEVTLTQLHELLHSIRFEQHPKQPGRLLIDAIVQETIANTGELSFAEELLSARELRWQYGHGFLQLRKPDPDLLAGLLACLEEDGKTEAELLTSGYSSEAAEQVKGIYATWTHYPAYGKYDLATVLGMQLSGVVTYCEIDFNELMKMPSEEVLLLGREWCETAA